MGYGEYDNYWYDGILNFGVNDNLAVKLSAARNNLRDGHYENIALGRDGVRLTTSHTGSTRCGMPQMILSWSTLTPMKRQIRIRRHY